MSDLYEARNSIYCYPNSDILKNNFNIRDNSKLEILERKLVLAKLYELRQNKQIGKFDIHHFVSIHKFLFEDIYPFAGLFRTENIAKGNFSFAEWQYIESELNRLLNELKNEYYFKDLSKDLLSKRLAYYMAEFNVLHPFREGNGRSMRLWLDHMLCIELQKTIDWSQIDKEIYLSAMERSPVNDLEIKAVLAEALTDDINNRELFMKGLDHSYYFEGYQLFKSEEL